MQYVPWTQTEHTAHILEFSFDYNNQARHMLLERRNFSFEHRDIANPKETRWGVGQSPNQGLQWVEP